MVDERDRPQGGSLSDDAVRGVFRTPSAKPATVTATEYVWMFHDLVLPEWVAEIALQEPKYAAHVKQVRVDEAPQPWGTIYRTQRGL